jgi:hypothetical protein
MPSSDCTSFTAVSAPQITTCGGNGNGLIDSMDSTTGTSSIGMWETFLAWQQMSDAGFIQGSYTGTGTSSSQGAEIPGLNAPASRIPNAGFEWTAFSSGGYWGSPTAQFPNATITYYQQYILFGAASGTSGVDLMTPALTGPEAASIDNKIDDGSPSTGALVAGGTGSAACASSATAYTNTAGIQCYLLFTVNW